MITSLTACSSIITYVSKYVLPSHVCVTVRVVVGVNYLAHMQFAGTQPLTLANLCLPQFEAKDTSRVESFVRSQRSHSYTFASEGRAFDEPQQRKRYSEDYDEASIAPSAKYQGIGFSSPILKARADKSQDTAPACVPANEPSNASEDYYEDGTNNKVNTDHKRDVSIRCSGKVSNKPSVAKSRSSRKAPPRYNMESTTRKKRLIFLRHLTSLDI